MIEVSRTEIGDLPKPIIFSAPMVRALLEGRKTQTRRLIKPAPLIDRMGNFCAPDRKGKVWNWGQNIGGTPRLRNFIQRKIRFAVGDRLWIRETWQAAMSDDGPCILYRADSSRWYPTWTGPDEGMGSSYDYDRYPADYSAWASDVEGSGPWASSIHMPRWASRLTLTVTNVRVQRLQGISKADAIAEGVEEVTAEIAANDASLRFWRRYHDGGWNGYVDHPIASYASLWTELHGAGSWEANPWIVALTFTVEQRNIDAVREAA